MKDIFFVKFIIYRQCFSFVDQKPKVIVLPESEFIEETTPFLITCFAESLPPAKVSLRLIHPNSTVQDVEGYNVSLTASSIMNGNFLIFCKAENIAGRTEVTKMFKSGCECHSWK